MNLQLTGRKMFGLGMLYLAVLSLISQDFIIGRPPLINTNPILADVLSIIVIVASLLIIFNHRTGGITALLIALLIFVFTFLVRYLPSLINGTFEGALWQLNGYKTLALIGGALIVSLSFFEESGNRPVPFLEKYNAVKYFKLIGSLTLAAFLIISGFAHFKYADFVTEFIPSYIPFHAFWTYFCGVCLIAGGIGLLISFTRKLAALLSGIMILSWFVLLHIPRIIANINDPSDRMGLGESFAFAGIFFVLTGLFSKENIG
jgi:uncharacterized membrane protein